MESKRSYLGSIQKGTKIGDGANSNVFMADFNGALCAYKEFCDPKYVAAIDARIKKISQHYGDPRYAFPSDFIYKKPADENFLSYVLDLISFYDNVGGLKGLSREEIIKILKLGRDSVEGLHEDYNIIHCDLSPWNFMYNKTLDRVILMDFDTNIDLSNKEIGPDKRLHSDVLLEYFKNHGIDKDADIFLYNLCCYALLNNCSYCDALGKITKEDFGTIEESGAQKILTTYKNFDMPKSLKKEYIIDYM